MLFNNGANCETVTVYFDKISYIELTKDLLKPTSVEFMSFVNRNNNWHFVALITRLTLSKYFSVFFFFTVVPCILILSTFYYQLMNKTITLKGVLKFTLKQLQRSFISSNLIHNSYINSVKLNTSTCSGLHPPILRRSMSLIIQVCSLWCSRSLHVAVLCTC